MVVLCGAPTYVQALELAFIWPQRFSPMRTLKIEEDGDRWKGIKPKIRLMGRWLEQAGFKPGERVAVTCIAPGHIELRSPAHHVVAVGRQPPGRGLRAPVLIRCASHNRRAFLWPGGFFFSWSHSFASHDRSLSSSLHERPRFSLYQYSSMKMSAVFD